MLQRFAVENSAGRLGSSLRWMARRSRRTLSPQRGVWGGAGASPRFKFGDAATDPAKFIATAISLEETGLGVYNGQAVSLTPKTLAAAARVVSVEARHAAWARALAGKDPAPVAVDAPISVSQAKQTFEPFIVK